MLRHRQGIYMLTAFGGMEAKVTGVTRILSVQDCTRHLDHDF